MSKKHYRHHRRAAVRLPAENRIEAGRFRIFSGPVFLLLAGIAVSACTTSKLASVAQDDAMLTTASIAQETESQGIEQGDLKAIQTAISSSATEPEPGNSLAWNNPDNGNEGTVQVLDAYLNRNGQKCRKFATKADTFMGISIYDGETCEVRKGFWGINWLKQRIAN